MRNSGEFSGWHAFDAARAGYRGWRCQHAAWAGTILPGTCHIVDLGGG